MKTQKMGARNMVGRKQQQGMIFALIAGALVVVAILMAVLSSSGGSNSATASQTTSLLSTRLQNDMIPIKVTFDNLVMSGSAASTVTYIPNTAGTNNLLDPTSGIQMPVSDPTAFTNTTFPNGSYIYQTGIKLNGINSAAAEIMIVAPGVKDGVCTQKNKSKHNLASIPASGAASTAFTTGATAAAPSSVGAVDMSALAAIAGWTEGCVSTTGGVDQNIYFFLLQGQ